MSRRLLLPSLLACLSVSASAGEPPLKWEPLFDGVTFDGWTVPEGDNGHWRIIDGVIDYDARSEARGDKNLWTQQEYKNFVLRLDWRIKRTTGERSAPVILPDGTEKLDANGQPVTTRFANADSGVYLRGTSKAQLNIWCWPIGSGEVYGYRNDKRQPPEVRVGVTPKVNADNPVGDWNTFVVTMRGDRLTVVLNGQTVLEEARLPGVPDSGRIALQHHGGFKNGAYSPASSLVQFRRIYIAELPDEPTPE